MIPGSLYQPTISKNRFNVLYNWNPDNISSMSSRFSSLSSGGGNGGSMSIPNPNGDAITLHSESFATTELGVGAAYAYAYAKNGGKIPSLRNVEIIVTDSNTASNTTSGTFFSMVIPSIGSEWQWWGRGAVGPDYARTWGFGNGTGYVDYATDLATPAGSFSGGTAYVNRLQIVGNYYRMKSWNANYSEPSWASSFYHHGGTQVASTTLSSHSLSSSTNLSWYFYWSQGANNGGSTYGNQGSVFIRRLTYFDNNNATYYPYPTEVGDL